MSFPAQKPEGSLLLKHLEGVLPHTVATPFGSTGVKGTELVQREGEGETALRVSEGQ